MKHIALTQGKYAIVDDTDYEKILHYTWYALHSQLSDHIWYAMASVNGRVIAMHRFLLDFPDGLEVDHKDGNGLNNTRENLRLGTKTQQRMNQKRYKNNKSGFKGVYWHNKSWYSQIRVNKQRIHLGRFKDKVDAAKAYNVAAQKHFGDFARLNQI